MKPTQKFTEMIGSKVSLEKSAAKTQFKTPTQQPQEHRKLLLGNLKGLFQFAFETLDEKTEPFNEKSFS